ncbi:type II toxin-antitoxin system HicB family antitoxin [Escherichia coli]|uniref:type II toxin-antitoxin system HicB family antitoxin n=1 Tax=Escherichia coli TaxID=562 RepID=UPI0030D3E0EC
MSNMLSYKGYFGSVEVSLEDNILHGKVQCINDIVTYEAETLDGLKAAFEEAVADYLETCEQLGKSPDKPMSGTFNIRIGRDLHKKAFLAAIANNTTLNDYVRKAIEEKVATKKKFILIRKAKKRQIHSFGKKHSLLVMSFPLQQEQKRKRLVSDGCVTDVTKY